MRHKNLLTVAGIISLSLMVVLTSLEMAQAKENVINLKLANYLPPQTAHTKIFAEFIRDLEERTEGRIRVKYFKGGSLLKGTTMYKGIESGLADIGFSHIYYTPGRMPVTELAGLPIGSPSAWVNCHVLNDFYFKFRPKEWDKVKVLWLSGTTTAVITTKKPVRKMGDLKGMTIRAPGIVGAVVKALGGTPAPTPMLETYDGIAKGVLDGVYGNYEILKAMRIAEVANYSTFCRKIGASFPFYTIMNKNSYRKLPPDLKEIFDRLCGEYAERFALMWNQIEFGGKSFGESKGMEFIDISGEEAVRWVKAVQVVIENQIKKLAGKGFPESDVRNWVSFLKERNEYYAKKQIEYRIP
ncbi:MAG: TRAP transporter substrate-binding protein [Deltaproteobacteria bacterium]|nr:TRAP transporter substrate-binding protein [Deltaproteobacteria bacterium]